MGRLVDTTLKLAFVTSNDVWIGVDGVDGGVAGLAKCGIVAVRPVNGIEESVEETSSSFETERIVDVVCLEENGVLRVDNGVGDLEVEVALTTSVDAWCETTIDTFKFRHGCEGNVRGQSSEELDEILGCIKVTLLEDAELIAWRSFCGLSNVVHGSDAGGCYQGIALSEECSVASTVNGIDLGLGQGFAEDGWVEFLACTGAEATLINPLIWVAGASSEKLEARCDVVDVLLNVGGQVVSIWCQNGVGRFERRHEGGNSLLAAHVSLSSGRVLVGVVVGPEEVLGLVGIGIELKPLLVRALTDAACGNAGRLKP